MNRARAVAGAIVVALFLTACPTATPDPDPTAPPRAGGALTIAYPWEPPTLDPFTRAGSSLPTRDLVRMLMPSLMAEDGTGLLDGAPSVERGDGFAVTLRLRGDATWSDGERITARDLIRTWRRARTRRLDPTLYRSVRSMQALPDGAVRVVFDTEPPRWRDLFSGGLGVLPAHMLGAWSPTRQWPVSGGPFVLVRWRPGLDMLFERNDRWWGPSAVLDRIRVVFVPDASAALDLFEDGRVDALGPYPAVDWQRRARDAGGTVVVADGTSTAVRLVMSARGPLADAAVRRAFVEAADLRRIVRGLAQAEAHDEPVPPARRLSRARARLADAGWRGTPTRARAGTELTFTVAVVNGDELGIVVARAMKFQGEDAAIRAEVIGLEDRRFWGQWLQGRDLRAALVTSRSPDARGMLLYRPVVSLVAGEGSVLDVAGGPGGPFERAYRWSRAA